MDSGLPKQDTLSLASMSTNVMPLLLGTVCAGLCTIVYSVLWSRRESKELTDEQSRDLYVSELRLNKSTHHCKFTPKTLEAMCRYDVQQRLQGCDLRAVCSYDPTACQSVNMIRKIQLKTHCLFASRALIWGSADWADSLSIADNIDKSLRSLTLFAAHQEGVDG